MQALVGFEIHTGSMQYNAVFLLACCRQQSIILGSWTDIDYIIIKVGEDFYYSRLIG